MFSPLYRVPVPDSDLPMPHGGDPSLTHPAYLDGLNPPLVEGASVVLHAKPSYYANRGTLSLAVRERLGLLTATLAEDIAGMRVVQSFTRTVRTRLPHSPVLSTSTMFLRASGLAIGATESSMSRKTWSDSSPCAFSRNRGFDPGTAWQERRARARP